jgi:drug/metabolite transporter (DMT)-like permease
MNDQTRGSVEMAGAMALLGTIGWFVLRAGVPVTTVVFFRCVFGTVALLVICGALGQLSALSWDARRFGLAVASGVAIVLNWLLLFSAYSRASISIATAVYNTQPFILVVFGALFLGERLTPKKVAWLGLAFAGMLMIVLNAGDLGKTHANYVAGIALALGAAVFWAIAALIGRKLTGTPPHLIALIHVSVGTVLLTPFQLSATWPTTMWSWSLLATMGVFHTGLVYILMYGALQRIPTHLQGTLSFVYPVVALLVDALAFHRRLEPLQLMGVVFILWAGAGAFQLPLPVGRPLSTGPKNDR